MPTFKRIYPPEDLKTELEQIMDAAETESGPDGISKDISIGDILGSKRDEASTNSRCWNAVHLSWSWQDLPLIG